MTAPTTPSTMRVGALRPNQLLHTYGVGAVADLPNLSVVMLGLDHWDLGRSTVITEERLLRAVRRKLGGQVQALRLPPHLPETSNPFDEWARVGVPVAVFPNWLRCSDTRCNRLGHIDAGLFDLLPHSYQPHLVRYVHACRGQGRRRPTAVPARFVLACDHGHLDDFPWSYFVHRGTDPGPGHSLKLTERGSAGETINIIVSCDQCGNRRPISDAIGQRAGEHLPACRGRHPHLGTYTPCDAPTRTLTLGATNGWFAMQLPVFSVPRATEPIDHVVAEYWHQLGLLSTLDAVTAKRLMPTQTCWPELEPYGVDQAYEAIQRRAAGTDDDTDHDELDLLTPEWEALTQPPRELPDFTIRTEPVPTRHQPWLNQVILAPRLRKVAALYGFTRIDAPEWDVVDTPDRRRGPLANNEPHWVPCAEMRGEGIFLRFNETRLQQWASQPTVQKREQALRQAHDTWRAQRQLTPDHWPGIRYLLLHTFAHALIRELALECGYSAAGIGERIYSRPDQPMAGVLLYTAAPDSEGTLGGLVSLGHANRLGPLIEQALNAARLCSSDPLCAEHDPTVHARLSGAACHACLFAAETSCERGNHYLDRALLVDTLTDTDTGFFTP